jgi:two-component system C4-dicarboxylate transport sensor histidine kinase DctB
LVESTRKLTACVELLDRTLRLIPRSTAPGPIVLAEVLEFLSRLYHSGRSAAQLDLSQVLAEPLPAISGVEDALEHALLNLIMNAMEALGDREDGRITVSAAIQPGQLELAIDDNGPGIAPAIGDRLFEPYVTTKSASRPVAGLGLAVARHLVELAGGTLVYIPKTTPGARFVMRLPTWSTAQREHSNLA